MRSGGETRSTRGAARVTREDGERLRRQREEELRAGEERARVTREEGSGCSAGEEMSRK